MAYFATLHECMHALHKATNLIMTLASIQKLCIKDIVVANLQEKGRNGASSKFVIKAKEVSYSCTLIGSSNWPLSI